MLAGFVSKIFIIDMKIPWYEGKLKDISAWRSLGHLKCLKSRTLENYLEMVSSIGGGQGISKTNQLLLTDTQAGYRIINTGVLRGRRI